MRLRFSLATAAMTVAALVLAPAVHAETTGATTLFNPASPGLLDKDLPESDPSNRFTVSGAVTFGENPQASIAVGCAHQEADLSVTPGWITPAAALDLGGNFSFETEKLGGTTCLVTALPGVSVTPADLAGYHGQIYTGADRESRRILSGINKGELTEVAFGLGTGTGIARIGDPVTSGSPDAMVAVSPGEAGLPKWSNELWGSDAVLSYSSGGRGALKVDGANTESTEQAATRNPEATGLLPLQVDSFSGGSDLHAVVTEPFMKCSGECEHYSSVGVQLRRASSTSRGGRVVDTRDSWQSTDGKSHSIDVIYEYGVEEPESGTNGFKLPWLGGGFASHEGGGVVPSPPGEASTIFAQRTLGNTSDTQGWMYLSTKPTLISFLPEGGFRMEFKRTVPAGGSSVIDQEFGIDTAAPAAAVASFATHASYRSARVAFGVTCRGLPGQSCKVGAVLTAKVSTGRHGARAARTVTLLNKTLTIASGPTRTVKLSLAKSATKLIPRHGALTANLVLSQAGGGKTVRHSYRLSLRR